MIQVGSHTIDQDKGSACGMKRSDWWMGGWLPPSVGLIFSVSNGEQVREAQGPAGWAKVSENISHLV